MKTRSPAPPSLLQQVRGRYLTIHYDVEGLLAKYQNLLEQLGVASAKMKTCQLQARMLYESHSAIHTVLKKMHISSSETRAAEMRFAGGLELSWNALLPTHESIEEYASLDSMEAWFQHGSIDESLDEMWALLEGTFVSLRDEVKAGVEPFVVELGGEMAGARVLVVPGQADVAWRQVKRADELEHPKLFQQLVKDLDSATSLLFMKPTFIEEFMEAMQKEMNQHPSKSQTYKMYDERLQQIYERSHVLPPVNEFETNDIRRTSDTPTNESPPGSVFRGRTTSGDLVSIKMLTAFGSSESARDTLYKEVQKWNRLRHPNLQRVLGIWYPNPSREGVFSLVSKGIKRGDLMSYIKQNPKYDRAQALMEIALGIQYLHSKDVPHGDIRGVNVLMRENGEPCVTNFGLMSALEKGCNVHAAMALLELGSVRWMAPEIYDAELVGQERGSPSKEADCHSFGMLILEVITGEKPFSYIDKDPVVVIELVRGGRPIRPLAAHNTRLDSDSAFQAIDDSLWHLCESCWSFPPENRPTMTEIVEALRTHQQTTRLEESRSRTGGHLLTLPKPVELLQIQAAPPPTTPGTPRTALPLAIEEGATPVMLDGLQIGTTNLAPSEREPSEVGTTLYVPQKAPSVASSRRRSPMAAIPPVITPVSPSPSYRPLSRAESRQSHAPSLAPSHVPSRAPSRAHSHVPSRAPSRAQQQQQSRPLSAQSQLPLHRPLPPSVLDTESDTTSYVVVNPTPPRDAIAEAQEQIDFQRRVLDEAQMRLNDMAEERQREQEEEAAEQEYDDDEEEEEEAEAEAEDPVLHEAREEAASIMHDGGSVKRSTPPTQDEPGSSKFTASNGWPKTARRSNDHRIQTIYTNFTPSYDSLRDARRSQPLPPPQSMRVASSSAHNRTGTHQRSRTSDTITESTRSSTITQQTARPRERSNSGSRERPSSAQARPRSGSQQSLAQSQTSGPSRASGRTARSPRHPDLRSGQSTPRGGSSVNLNLMEAVEAPLERATRLSTIPDVTDGEEDFDAIIRDHIRQPLVPVGTGTSRSGAISPGASQGGGEDWSFLRLVEQQRKQRKPEGNKDGTFIPPPRASVVAAEEALEAEAPVMRGEFDSPPQPSLHQFPPLMPIIPTPASLAKSKSLPPIPPPSTGGSQWWDDQQAFDTLEGTDPSTQEDDDDNATIPRNPRYNPLDDPKPPRTQSSTSTSRAKRHKKKDSNDSAVTAIHVSQLGTGSKAPWQYSLPPSTAGHHSSSGRTSHTAPPIQRYSNGKSNSNSNRTVAGTGGRPSSRLATQQPQPQHIMYTGDGSETDESSLKGPTNRFAGNKTNSTLSTNTPAVLAGIGEAVCPTCGRVFSNKQVLDAHIIKQAGRCRQRTLQQDLQYVGEFDEV